MHVPINKFQDLYHITSSLTHSLVRVGCITCIRLDHLIEGQRPSSESLFMYEEIIFTRME